jgi:hypothetical protein
MAAIQVNITIFVRVVVSTALIAALSGARIPLWAQAAGGGRPQS